MSCPSYSQNFGPSSYNINGHNPSGLQELPVSILFIGIVRTHLGLITNPYISRGHEHMLTSSFIAVSASDIHCITSNPFKCSA